ncbi:hypothetical protein [Spirosoma agri]|uniref:Glycerophosphoryl diester phosphodiesterase membrane domain-containing protein n=1 Tax=Spirosoma agri TaxID=1987381 RepID=A0A6M0IKL3_9BACT|nr:hypothetical protein [Spirosoma agri]NEU68829.1 hypothetical protein [Spirosoma agri]
MIPLFQQRDFGNKINVTFQYISENFRSLGLSLLYIVGPVALGAGIATGILQSRVLAIAAETSNGKSPNPMAIFQVMSQFASPTFWLVIILGILANVVVILTTYAHMKVYERTNGGPIMVSDVWAEVQPMIGRAVVISILSSIVTGVGFVFLFIPGVYVAVVLSLALAVTAFEGTDFGMTWERCFRLIRDKWWSTFGIILVIGIIVAIVGLIFQLPNGVIGFLIGAKLLPNLSTVWFTLASVIGIVGRTLLNAVLYTAIGFQYTNLVERQEGRGLISAIDSIGTNPSQPRSTDEGSF